MLILKLCGNCVRSALNLGFKQAVDGSNVWKCLDSLVAVINQIAILIGCEQRKPVQRTGNIGSDAFQQTGKVSSHTFHSAFVEQIGIKFKAAVNSVFLFSHCQRKIVFGYIC